MLCMARIKDAIVVLELILEKLNPGSEDFILLDKSLKILNNLEDNHLALNDLISDLEKLENNLLQNKLDELANLTNTSISLLRDKC